MSQSQPEEQIYMDYAAATPLHSQVKAAMMPYFQDIFGNPSANHTHGRQAAQALDSFRQRVADIFTAQPREIIFTSGATESNTLAVGGFLRWLQAQEGDLSDYHMVCSSIEHSSVIEIVKRFSQKWGLQTDFVTPNTEGIVSADRVADAMQPNTVFVSIMYVNGEIGTTQPVSAIASRIRKLQNRDMFDAVAGSIYPLLHTDATQAPLFRKISTQTLQADLISIDAQKIYGPKGSGALYVTSDVDIQPVLVGGGQEFGLRSGTENIPLIAGLMKALELAEENREAFRKDMARLQQAFISQVQDKISHVRINGSIEQRIENNVSISISGQDHTFLATKMDNHGISVATKSACLEDDKEGSPVVTEISDDSSTDEALRFTFGRANTTEHIEYATDTLADICK